jgi:predicted lipid-binding transport protein (Tim44 family)
MLPPEWSHRLRGAQFGFIAGIVIGLVFGWIFHGIISMAFRFGLLVLLLLPLIIIGWLWFRSQRAPRPQNMDYQQQQQRAGRSWSAVVDVTGTSQRRAEEPADVEFVDVPLIRQPTRTTPDEIEAELEALKRERERGS